MQADHDWTSPTQTAIRIQNNVLLFSTVDPVRITKYLIY